MNRTDEIERLACEIHMYCAGDSNYLHIAWKAAKIAKQAQLLGRDIAAIKKYIANGKGGEMPKRVKEVLND